MEDMKNWIYIILISLFAGSVVACSEDDITPDPEISALPYDLPRGEEGSLEELIYTFHEKYGSFIVYDVDEVTLNTTWESRLYYEIVPVKESYRDCMCELIAFMLDEVFVTYPDEFIAQLLPRRVYLVDTLIENGEVLSIENLTNHSMVISRVGEEMASFTETDWESFNTELTGAVLGNIEIGQEFYDLIDDENILFGMLADYVEDPENEYDAYHYGMYVVGFLTSSMNSDAMAMFYVPEEVEDLASYLTFIMSTSASEIEHMCERFEIVRNRAQLVVQFLRDEMDLDLIAIQNANCPDDPLAADFFNE